MPNIQNRNKTIYPFVGQPGTPKDCRGIIIREITIINSQKSFNFRVLNYEPCLQKKPLH
jgi:hypothetical protein